MRLLLVIDHIGVGGAQRQLTNLAAGLARRGHDVDIFCYHVRDHFLPFVAAAGVRVLAEPKLSRYSWAPVRRLRQTFRATQYDAALAYLPVPNFYALLAGLGLKHRPPVIVSERGTPPAGKGSLPHKLIERCYRRADHVVVNSYHLADYYRQKYRRLADRVSTIWNSVELDKFPAAPPLPPPAAAEGELRLLALGNMRPSKNWHCLLDALAILRDQHGRRPIVDYAGRLTELNAEDSAYLKSLEAQIARLGLAAQWQFLGARSDVPQLFATHHALVHPSYLEGLPNVVCEALASGRPVVLSDTLDHPRLVQPEKTGWLFDWRSPAALAQTIARLYDVPVAQWTTMSQSARQFAETAFAPQRFLEEYEALFAHVAGTRGQGSPGVGDRRSEIGDRKFDDPASERSSHITPCS